MHKNDDGLPSPSDGQGATSRASGERGKRGGKTPPQEHVDLVNEALPGATLAGAYCLGHLAYAYWTTGKVPTREIVEQVAACKTMEEGKAIVEEFAGRTFAVPPPMSQRGWSDAAKGGRA